MADADPLGSLTDDAKEQPMATHKVTALATTTATVVAAAVVGSLASAPDSAYYESLSKPSWNPPNAVFPVTWTVLYSDIAVVTGLTLAELREQARDAEGRRYLTAVVINLVLNGGWSWAFFQAKNPAVSAVWAGVLAASSTDLVRRTWRVRRVKGAALSPYAAWAIFATALSAEIWRLNG